MNPPDECDRLCLDLASALCARLCHDISSPAGTLAGTLELAIEEPAESEEAMEIASEAANILVKRLQLLRAAWAGDCGAMNRTRLADLATGLPPRVRAALDELAPGPFEGKLSRILLNLLLLGADALPAGGIIALAGEPGAGIVLTVEGPSVAWNEGLAAALLDPASLPSTEPRTVQTPLTVRLIRAAGLHLSFLAPPPSRPTQRIPPAAHIALTSSLGLPAMIR